MQAISTHRAKSWLLAASLLLTLALPGCMSVRLIGEYDATIDQGVTAVQQQAELHYAKMNADPLAPVDENFYQQMEASIAVLHTRATALPKYDLIAQQLALLQSSFDDQHQLDKISKRPLPPKMFATAQSGMETSIGSILRLELALKRGESP